MAPEWTTELLLAVETLANVFPPSTAPLPANRSHGQKAASRVFDELETNTRR